MIKTLVIHPFDKTTDFLIEIYKKKQGLTLIRGDITKEEVGEMIQKHDRIIMLGHGMPDGLLSVEQFRTFSSFIVDYSMIKDLKFKKRNIYIWCDADEFVIKHQLSGFCTGMFISETREVKLCKLPPCEERYIEESNAIFASLVSKYFYFDEPTMYKEVKRGYRKLIQHNPIAKYNYDRVGLY